MIGTRYCWQDPAAPWLQNIDLLREIIQGAVGAYLEAYQRIHGDKVGTMINEETDFSTPVTPSTILPLIPDVALQYRCGDNLGFSYMYGILPFFAFKERIPADAKYIYVLSDHPSRAPHSPYTSRCQTILKALFDYLKENFPQATIVVKRGGDLFLDYARFARAKTTICSASSYCLWPALANAAGVVHFPLTAVVAGADSIELAPKLAINFKWIEKPLIISDFRKYRPWDSVIDVLRGLKPVPT